MFVTGWVFPTVRLADPCALADMHTRRLLCIVVEAPKVVLSRVAGGKIPRAVVTTTRARTRTTARTTRTATLRAVATLGATRP